MMYTLLVEKEKSKAKDTATKENAEAKQGDAGDSTESIAFSAGNPRVEHITGVVHLYRDLSENASDEAAPSSQQVIPALCSAMAVAARKIA
jgi:hypothetical protein